MTGRGLARMDSSADHYNSFGHFVVSCPLPVPKELLVDPVLLAVESVVVAGDSKQVDGPSLVTFDNNLIFVVYVFVASDILSGASEHPFALLVGEGIAIGEEDLGCFGEDEIEVHFCVILFGLSSIN
jgi:hypothetical protein